MRNIFLTEMQFSGKIEKTYLNMRTEFAWMCALEADHMNINKFNEVNGYDNVFLIIPKGRLFLSAEGSKCDSGINPISDLLKSDIIKILKSNNLKVHFIQEGPSWWFNDYEIEDQFNFIKIMSEVDTIFTHNTSDIKFYKGWFPNKKTQTIPTLMYNDAIKDTLWNPENKIIIGGNFSRWYGGIQSFRVAQEFELPIWTITSHSKRNNEENVEGLKHLPRVMWNDWMKHLSTFKYAIHLIPTVAAGTFSLNCAYFGIPCIGNELVDTQSACFPDLSVDVNDMKKALELASRLKNDIDFYNECSSYSKNAYIKHYHVDVFKKHMNGIL